MHRNPLAAIALACAAALGGHLPAEAASTYIGLGDSITFGETDLDYVRSFGDRGYVGAFADVLADRAGGVRPNVINLAIDGETTTSFMTGAGRTVPVEGRTDPILARQNLNYDPGALVSQQQLFRSTLAAQQAAGNTVDTISMTLGVNELLALGASPGTALQLLPSTLMTVQANYSAILTDIRQALPDADIYLLGYFNPFPADPGNPAGPVVGTGGPMLNSIIQGLASQFGASFVDTATPFVGHEAQYTYMDEMPAGSTVGPPFGGTLPLGNVHPNALGYAVIGAQVAAVPEPSSVLLMGAGGLLVAAWAGRRRKAAGPGRLGL